MWAELHPGTAPRPYLPVAAISLRQVDRTTEQHIRKTYEDQMSYYQDILTRKVHEAPNIRRIHRRLPQRPSHTAQQTISHNRLGTLVIHNHGTHMFLPMEVRECTLRLMQETLGVIGRGEGFVYDELEGYICQMCRGDVAGHRRTMQV